MEQDTHWTEDPEALRAGTPAQGQADANDKSPSTLAKKRFLYNRPSMFFPHSAVSGSTTGHQGFGHPIMVCESLAV